MSDPTASVMLPVSEQGYSILVQFKIAILNISSADRKVFCQRISKQLRLGDFPFIFAGVLLAKRERLTEAEDMLSMATKNSFAQHLKRYLGSRNPLSVSPYASESALPLNAWTRTPISCLEMRKTVAAFTEFALAGKRLVGGETLSILDIGTGNGILLSLLVNRLTQVHKFPIVRLFLLDSSAEMLRVASHNCRQIVSVPLHISTIHRPIELLGKAHISSLQKENLTFTMSAGCLHHLPDKRKQHAFSLIRKFSQKLLMEELEANHDLPDTDSPELVWSVQCFYSSLINSVKHSRLTPLEKRKCIDDFLLAEAVGILEHPRNTRGNFHTVCNEWSRIAHAGGFQVSGIRTTILNKHGLRSLAFDLTSDLS